MTFNKAFNAAPTEPGEEVFGATEVLYSRTDNRGVISAANAVFHRLAGREPGASIGAPHNIVRHPDTPKVIFWLMWKSLNEGQAFMAYLKNKSARGGWYWVLSVIVPCEGGFISGQIKPSGALFAEVKSLYAELGKLEETRSLPPEAILEHLQKKVSDLGFASYSDFISSALDQEILSLEKAIDRANPLRERALVAVKSSLAAALKQQELVLADFDALQSIPTNMRIIASRLEPSGGPISAISDNYRFASSEILRRLEGFAGQDGNLVLTMTQILGEGFFLTGIERFLSAIGCQFGSESAGATSLDLPEERRILSGVSEKYTVLSQASLGKAEVVSGELNVVAGEVRRRMLGLDTIRVMGRVESGRLGSAGIGLAATIDQLDTRHVAINEHLLSLMDLCIAIQTGIHSYQRQAEKTVW